MSFLLRTSTRTLRAPIARTTVASFHSTPLQHKSAVDATKDAAAKVNRTVSDGIVAGIDKSAELADKAKSAVNSDSGEMKGKAAELKGEAKGKAEELKGTAKGKAEEVKGKM